MALECGRWSASGTGRFTSEKDSVLLFPLTGVWVGIGAGLDGMENLAPPGFDYHNCLYLYTHPYTVGCEF